MSFLELIASSGLSGVSRRPPKLYLTYSGSMFSGIYPHSHPRSSTSIYALLQLQLHSNPPSRSTNRYPSGRASNQTLDDVACGRAIAGIGMSVGSDEMQMELGDELSQVRTDHDDWTKSSESDTRRPESQGQRRNRSSQSSVATAKAGVDSLLSSRNGRDTSRPLVLSEQEKCLADVLGSLARLGVENTDDIMMTLAGVLHLTSVEFPGDDDAEAKMAAGGYAYKCVQITICTVVMFCAFVTLWQPTNSQNRAWWIWV